MHLKRTKMPDFWPISRKEDVWAIVTARGPHSGETSIPLSMVLRDILKLTSTLTEAKRVLNEGRILVNGICRKDYRYPIGAMDILEMPDTKTAYRAMPSHGGFNFEESKDTSVLSRVTNKVALKGGKIQYTTHNGMTLIAENKYAPGDTLRMDGKKKITAHFPLALGSTAIVTEGKLRGTEGRIKDIGLTVKLETQDGSAETIKDYLFVTGAKAAGAKA